VADNPVKRLARLLGGVALTHGRLPHQVLGQLLISNASSVEVAGATVVVTAATRQGDAMAQAALRTAAPALAVQVLSKRQEQRLRKLADANLERLRAEQQRQDRQLADLQEQRACLEARARELDDHAALLDTRELEARQQHALLEARESEVRQWAARLDARDLELQQWTAQLDQQQAILREREVELDDRQQQGSAESMVELAELEPPVQRPQTAKRKRKKTKALEEDPA
jgi:hypothetical protein